MKQTIFILMFLVLVGIVAGNNLITTNKMEINLGNVTNLTRLNTSIAEATYLYAKVGNFTEIYSKSWLNVTISESQIYDLVHTTDTWNTTEEIITAANTTGWLINWNSTGFISVHNGSNYKENSTYLNIFNDKMISFSEKTLNNTIDAKLVTTYYNVTNISLVRGTHQGTLQDAQTYNGVSYNVTEVSGANGLDVRFNFTNVEDFNQLLFRYKTGAGESHTVSVQIFEFDDSSWENYDVLSLVSDYTVISLPVLDPDEHLKDGSVMVRFFQSSNGNTGHKHHFDYVTISDGFATPSGAEVDPLAIQRTQINKSQFVFDTQLNINSTWLNILELDNTFSSINSNFTDIDTAITGLNLNISLVNTSTNIVNLGFVTGSHTTDTWNESTEMLAAVNATSWVINWNSTGFISKHTVDTNLSAGGKMSAALNMTNNDLLSITTIKFNSSRRIFDNGTGICIVSC